MTIADPRRPLTLVVCTLMMLSLPASGLTPGQIDNFEDGTVAGWVEGGPSPNQPTNVADGGPMGAGDAYLENIATGGAGPGSRLAMFNLTQWSCDYNAFGGVVTIVAEMANFGATPLAMRIGVESGTGTLTRYVSTNAAALPADGVWRTVTFVIDDMEMTQVEGTQTLMQVLDDVNELRILSVAAGPAWQGDAVDTNLGVDNIRVQALPVGLESFSID